MEGDIHAASKSFDLSSLEEKGLPFRRPSCYLVVALLETDKSECSLAFPICLTDTLISTSGKPFGAVHAAATSGVLDLRTMYKRPHDRGFQLRILLHVAGWLYYPECY
jgi:hypothetical protein